MLNGNPIGGKKRKNLMRDDLWTMRYLSKFKWDNLNEKFEYDQKVKDQRMKLELAQAKRENHFFLEKVELSKKIEKIEETAQKKIEKLEKDEEENEEADPIAAGVKRKRKKNLEKMLKYNQRSRRRFKQTEPIKNN